MSSWSTAPPVSTPSTRYSSRRSFVRRAPSTPPPVRAPERGLTQLLPATAQDVAKSLGLGVPAADDLARPAVNLTLGAAYLAQQGKTAAGDLSRTLAAYNAGAGNAARWATAANGDPDLFYESVDFGETRAYIRLVSQNYAMYQRLYRSLPR